MKKLMLLITVMLAAASMFAQKEFIQSVDLGLSIRWANMNIGAINPKDPGGYYASRETRIKTGYMRDNWLPESDASKGDVALVKWKYWRMPTQEEIDELFEKCSFERFRESDGRSYCKVTGPNGNHIILPLAGYYDDYEQRGWLTRYNGRGSAGFIYNAQSKRLKNHVTDDSDGGRSYQGSMVRAVTPHVITNQEPIDEHIKDLPKFGDRGEYGFYAFWLREYRKKRSVYPPFAKENKIEGVVVVSFTVETDGSLSDFRIEKSIHESLDNDAINTLKNMPKWTPGKRNGEIVPMRYVLPIRYNIRQFYD